MGQIGPLAPDQRQHLAVAAQREDSTRKEERLVERAVVADLPVVAEVPQDPMPVLLEQPDLRVDRHSLAAGLLVLVVDDQDLHLLRQAIGMLLSSTLRRSPCRRAGRDARALPRGCA
jgi:hypothetical protein